MKQIVLALFFVISILTTRSPVYAGADVFCGDSSHVRTAIGCIGTTPTEFFKSFFDIGIGMAGGIAFLLILFGGFQILTSAGNPERLTEGKELVESAIAGLLLIIFSVFLLKFIGVNVLCIPGFESC